MGWQQIWPWRVWVKERILDDDPDVLSDSNVDTIPDTSFVGFSNVDVVAIIVSILGPEDVIEAVRWSKHCERRGMRTFLVVI